MNYSLRIALGQKVLTSEMYCNENDCNNLKRKNRQLYVPFSCYNTGNCASTLNNFGSTLESITLSYTPMG